MKLTIAIIILLFPITAFANGECYNLFTESMTGDECSTHLDCGGLYWIFCVGFPDADGDDMPDTDDNDTICGYVTGAITEGVYINIARIIAVIETDEDGYYAIGDLTPDHYVVVPDDDYYVFDPRYKIIPID